MGSPKVTFRIIAIIVMLVPLIILVTDEIEAYSDKELVYCVNTLQSAELGIEIDDLYNSCADLLTTGEAFLPDFRDRGLLIIWVELGDSVSISLSLTSGDYL